MAVCRARSLSHLGIDAVPVEADVSAGLPGFSIVGLPDAAVLEARGRGFAGIKQRLQVPHEEGHREPRTRQPAYLGRSDRKSTRLNSSHANISYAVFCLKKKQLL